MNGSKIPFYKDYQLAILLYAVASVLFLMWLHKSGWWPLPENWLGLMWFVTTSLVAILVHFSRKDAQPTSDQRNKRGTDSKKNGEDTEEGDMGHRSLIASVLCGAGFVGVDELLRTAGIVAFPSIFRLPIAFAVIGLSYVTIRHFRGDGRTL